MRSILLVIVVGLALALSCPGCAPKEPTEGSREAVAPPKPSPAPAASDLTGTIRISGAWALYPMVVRWGELFRRVNPKVKMDIAAGGAGKGAADALGGLVEVGMVSRAIHPDEIDKGGWFVPVCIDAVFPTINAENPEIDTLLKTGAKRETFAGIWLTGTVTTWGQVAGKSGGEKVHVFQRSDACGAAETWAKFMDTGRKQEDLKGTGVYGDPGLAEAVLKDPLAIGFNNLNYAFDTKTGEPVEGLRILPIDRNGNGLIDADEDFYASRDAVTKAIQDGKYPSPPARELNFLCKGAPTAVTAAFVKWVLTEGQSECLSNGYIPLTQEKDAEALRKLG
jgi:phosphate transport system substrate-binding protein